MATNDSNQENGAITFEGLKVKMATLVELLVEGHRSGLTLSSEVNQDVMNYIKSGKMNAEELIYIQEQNNKILLLLEAQMQRLSTTKDDSSVVASDSDKYSQLLKKFNG